MKTEIKLGNRSVSVRGYREMTGAEWERFSRILAQLRATEIMEDGPQKVEARWRLFVDFVEMFCPSLNRKKLARETPAELDRFRFELLEVHAPKQMTALFGIIATVLKTADVKPGS